MKYKDDNDGNIYSYSKVNIRHSSKNIVQVWEKRVLSEESRKEYIQIKKDDGKSTKGWDKLSYNIILSEIDCNKKMIHVLSVNLYDTNGDSLDYFSVDNPKWDYIIPDSNTDNLQKKVCPNK